MSEGTEPAALRASFVDLADSKAGASIPVTVRL